MQLISVELLMSEQQKNDVLVNDETVVPQADVSEQFVSVTPPGALLASARKTKHLSVEDVASYLKLATRQVHAIEADNYDALPGMAITRGFIRTYAKLVGIDAVPLLDALPKQEMRLGAVAGSSRVQSATFSESTLPLRDRKKFTPALLFAGIAAAVAVAVGGFYFLHHTDDENPSPLGWLFNRADTEVVADAPADNVAQPEVQTTVTDLAPLSTFERVPVASLAPLPSAVAPTPTTPTPAPVEASLPVVAATPVVASAQAVVPAAPVQTTTAGDVAKPTLNITKSKDLLRLSIREDAWVEIRRADDTVVFSRLLLAGTSESFDVPEPLQLVVGNASGVAATLRGQPLALPVSKNNVARISLK
jgi:cytoskeleton protein RodZ